MRKAFVEKLGIILILVFMASNLLAGCNSSKLSKEGFLQNNTTGDNTTKQDSTDTNANLGTNASQGTGANSGTGNEGKGTNSAGQSHEPQKKKVKVKGLYLTGWTVGNMSKVKHYIDLANTTEINTYVVDIKDDDGYVGYESSIPEVRNIGAWKKKYDVDKVLQAFHENNIYVIGRLVVFKDPILSSNRPDLAVKDINGGLWRDNHKLTWLDPYNKDSWPYIIEIAKEAVKKGFDEIQFDYVRFPNDGNKKAMSFADGGLKKYEAINNFLAYARKELPGVVLSADVFGIICESPGDTEDIGQYLELVGKDIDYISPMVYPSHYAVGQVVNGVKYLKPDLEPYGVVFNSLVKAKDRISKVDWL